MTPQQRLPSRGDFTGGRKGDPPGEVPSPVGEAFGWASRILAIGLAMFLPAVAGNWLDARFGTGFLGPVGLVLGFSGGIAWLVRLGNSSTPARARSRSAPQTSPSPAPATDSRSGPDRESPP